MSTQSSTMLRVDGELPPNSPLRDTSRLDIEKMMFDDPEDKHIAGGRLSLLLARMEAIDRILASDVCPSGGLSRLECSDCAMGKRGHRIQDIEFEHEELIAQIGEIKNFLKQGKKS